MFCMIQSFAYKQHLKRMNALIVVEPNKSKNMIKCQPKSMWLNEK